MKGLANRLLGGATITCYATATVILVAPLRNVMQGRAQADREAKGVSLSSLLRPSELAKHKVGRPIVVAYVDFQCPFCREALPKLVSLEKIAAGNVELSVRQYPLASIHSKAYPAAVWDESVRGMGRTDRDLIWSMCTMDLEKVFDSGKSVDEFARVSLTRERTQRARSLVDGDLAAAQRLKLKGTPAYYVVLSSGKIKTAYNIKEISYYIDNSS